MPGRFRGLVVGWLSTRYLPVWAAAIAVLLTLPSLGAGLILDDYHHCLVMRDPDNPCQFFHSRLDLFSFAVSPEQVRRNVDLGLAPWWTGHDCKAAFWRPLSSLSHFMDYTLWPDTPSLMHLQSILWYAALCASTAMLYGRIMPVRRLAGLAALLFAADGMHALPVGFLANRNTLISAVFGVLAIAAHDRWRRRSWKPGIGLGLLLLTLSLLAKEAGLATCAYLAAYAMFLDEAKLSKRILSLIPYAAVVIVWRVVYSSLGYGISNVGIYFDPITEPQRYLEHLHVSAVFFLAGKWAFLPPDAVLLLPRQTADIAWIAAVVFLAVLAVMLAPLLRRDRAARFWAAGMVISLLPACTTIPSSRMLMFISIGAGGLMAQFIGTALAADHAAPRTRCWRYPAVVLASLLLLIHTLISPVCLAVQSAMPMGPRQFIENMCITSFPDEAVTEQDVIVVNPPVALFAGFSMISLQCNDQPIPKHMRALTSTLMQPVTIHRPDARTLLVRPKQGFLAPPLGSVLGHSDGLCLGGQTRLTGVTIEITELTDDGRPAEASFTFDVRLEDSSLRWLHWQDWAYRPFTPPGVGETQVLYNLSSGEPPPAPE